MLLICELLLLIFVKKNLFVKDLLAKVLLFFQLSKFSYIFIAKNNLPSLFILHISKKSSTFAPRKNKLHNKNS